MLATVASVLHLGNISFQQGDMDNAELLDEKSEDAMYTVSHLMQLSFPAFHLSSTCLQQLKLTRKRLH